MDLSQSVMRALCGNDEKRLRHIYASANARLDSGSHVVQAILSGKPKITEKLCELLTELGVPVAVFAGQLSPQLARGIRTDIFQYLENTFGCFRGQYEAWIDAFWRLQVADRFFLTVYLVDRGACLRGYAWTEVTAWHFSLADKAISLGQADWRGCHTSFRYRTRRLQLADSVRCNGFAIERFKSYPRDVRNHVRCLLVLLRRQRVSALVSARILEFAVVAWVSLQPNTHAGPMRPWAHCHCSHCDKRTPFVSCASCASVFCTSC